MPYFRQAAASSSSGSRPNGVASYDVAVGLAFEWNIAKPSWCLEVMTMYFMPASLAMRTHSSALNLTGLNCLA